MMNCFPFISTNPKGLEPNFESTRKNDSELYEISAKCKDVVFAWGNFEIVRDYGRDIQLSRMFPNALCLARNKNGTPKHPLYCKSDTILQPYNN